MFLSVAVDPNVGDGLIQFSKLCGQLFASDFVESVIDSAPKKIMLKMYDNHIKWVQSTSSSYSKELPVELDQLMRDRTAEAIKAFVPFCVEEFNDYICPQLIKQLRELHKNHIGMLHL